MSAPLTATRRPFTGPVTSLLTVVVLGSGLLAGCSGDDSPDADASQGATDAAASSASPSGATEETTGETTGASEETTAGDVPLAKAPKARNTPEGRKAWTEFVVERWGYALATNKAAAVTDLGAKGGSCQGCKELEKELDKRRKQGWAVDFPGATVDKVTVKPAGAPGTFEATAVIDIPASQSFFEDGTYRNENEAFKDAEFIVQMKYTKARYVLVSYRVA